MKLKFFLNGKSIETEIRPEEKLLAVLRRLGARGIKQGCEDGSCGMCTVLLDGKAVLSCLLFAAQVMERKVTTIEGLGNPLKLHPIQEAFLEAGAVQCGYCTPAMILTTKELLDSNLTLDEETIKQFMDGVYCRCTGYVKIIEAIKKAKEKQIKD